ncbi:MAG: sugar transporter permease [Paenibacillaceae bacterium]|jgi:putative aldouronate transport system permease protein|nr:sugar transporter permease [Paenibacillaceae bacterium]
MRKSFDEVLFEGIARVFIGLMALFCAIPFVMLVSGSFSSEEQIMKHGYSLFPRGFSTDAYKFIVESPQKLLNAYGVTIVVTGVSCLLALWLISMTAYVLFREDFRYRNNFAFFFYLTTIFNGGMLPAYILMVRYLHLKNSILALILPGIFSVFFLLIMRNFMRGTIPGELIESSKIDGAGDFYIYWRIVLPLMKPALATIGLFEVIGYWNNWYNAMLYINDQNLYPLQYLLYRILTAAQGISESAMDSVGVVTMPKETFKLAMTVVAIGPIVLAYPFVQRYFVQGITIGAVKG